MSDTIHPVGDKMLAVGERMWPAQIYVESADLAEAGVAKHYHRRQARVMFESGWGLSIAWGSGTYSNNHDAWGEAIEESPTTVEVGINDGSHLVDGKVAGYVDADFVNELLDEISRWPTTGAHSLPAHLHKQFD
jgi:hypothetical protein